MPYAVEIKTEWQLNCLVRTKKVVHNLLRKNLGGRDTRHSSIPCPKTKADETLNRNPGMDAYVHPLFIPARGANSSVYVRTR